VQDQPVKEDPLLVEWSTIGKDMVTVKSTVRAWAEH
jgi:hypothetical protein